MMVRWKEPPPPSLQPRYTLMFGLAMFRMLLVSNACE
jgi:hypothetical protein